MADDDQKTSSPTVLYDAGQANTDHQQSTGSVDSQGRPPGAISLDDEDLKLVDMDVLEAMESAEFYPKVFQWLEALHDSFDYDITLVPENKLELVPLMGTTPQNLTTTDKHFSVDNDANRVNPTQLYFAEATLMVLALTKAIAKRTKHRPDLDDFRGRFAEEDELRWLENIGKEAAKNGYISESSFDNNEAVLKIKEQIQEAAEVATRVAPYLLSEDGGKPEASDERDVDVERVKPLLEEAKKPSTGTQTESDTEAAGEEAPPTTEEEQQKQQELAERLPSFDALIDPEIPAVVAYLAAAFRASGTQVPDAATLEAFARTQLRALDADTLLGIAAGIPLYREKHFSTMSKALLAQYTAQQDREGRLVQELALDNLRGLIAIRLSDGLTPDEILAELEVLSAQELTLLLGLEITAANEEQVRASVRERATQLLISLFSAPPTGKKVVAARQRTAAAYSTAAPDIKAKNEEIDTNVNKAAEGSKTTGQKVQSFLKAYQKSWAMLSQDEQLMVYFLADLPIGDKMFESNKPLDLRLPLPFEFVNFAYATYGKEFQDLVKRFQLDPKEFKRIYKDSLLKSELLAAWKNKKSATNTVEYIAAYKQQQAEINLDAYQFLNHQEKLKIAKAAGFASVAAFEAALTAEAANTPVFAEEQIITVTQITEVPGEVEIIYEQAPNPMANEEVISGVLGAEHGAELQDYYEELGVADQGYQANVFDGPPSPRRGGLREAAGGRLKQVAKERVGQAFKQARQKMVKKAGQKVAQQALKQGVRAAGKAASGYTAGLSWLASEIATNKKLREYAAAGATLTAAHILNILGSAWGGAGALIGGGLGWVVTLGNPLGILGGAALGAGIGHGIGETLGMNPRVFSARQYPIGQSPVEPSMAQLRNQGAPASSTAANTAPDAQAGRGGGAGGSYVQPAPVASTAAPAAIATATAAAASTLTGLLTAAVYPVIAMSGIFFATMFALMVIWGAFLVPTPEEAGQPPALPGDPGGPGGPSIPVNPYITVRKFANPTKIENNTTATITYTIQVESKSGYVVKVNSFTDVFTTMGEEAPQNLQSPTTGSEFGEEMITTGKDVTYPMAFSGVDALVTNTVTINFDVYTIGSDVPVKTNQSALARTSVTIGSPRLGCWPASGWLAQLEGGSFSHVGFDAIDIMATPGRDWNVYAPIAGDACALEQNKRWNADTGTWIYSGYGRYIQLRGEFDGRPVTLIFGHFSTYLSGLEPGSCQFVQPGTPLGIMDSTGFSDGDHVHYELRPGSGLKLRDLIINSENIQKNDVVTSCFSPAE